jgi:hypothetical protein
MDEHLFLKGQRVITPEGEGEIIDAIGDNIEVKLDNGGTNIFPSDDIQDDSSRIKAIQKNTTNNTFKKKHLWNSMKKQLM